MVEGIANKGRVTGTPAPRSAVNDTRPRIGIRALLTLAIVQLICGIILAVDVGVEIYTELTSEADEAQYGLAHLSFEVFATVLLFFAFVLSSRQVLAHRAELRDADQRLETIRSDFAGLVERRFREWDLSPAEKEVAMLTIKGLRISEIAATRDCTEGTVKSHLSAIFRKSQVSSRPELLARFVDDFLDFAAVE